MKPNSDDLQPIQFHCIIFDAYVQFWSQYTLQKWSFVSVLISAKATEQCAVHNTWHKTECQRCVHNMSLLCKSQHSSEWNEKHTSAHHIWSKTFPNQILNPPVAHWTKATTTSGTSWFWLCETEDIVTWQNVFFFWFSNCSCEHKCWSKCTKLHSWKVDLCEGLNLKRQPYICLGLDFRHPLSWLQNGDNNKQNIFFFDFQTVPVSTNVDWNAPNFTAKK